MTKMLAPYGDNMNAEVLAKVGKGKQAVSDRLVARMPSAGVAAKVGGRPRAVIGARRVIRRKA